MFILRLSTEKAILLRAILMSGLQGSAPESRPEIQEILDSVNMYLAISLRNE